MLLNLLGCVIALTSFVYDEFGDYEKVNTSVTISSVNQSVANFVYNSSNYTIDLDGYAIDDENYLDCSFYIQDYVAENGGKYNISLGKYTFRVTKRNNQYIPSIGCFYDNSDYSFIYSLNIVPFVTFNVSFDNDFSTHSYTYFNTYLLGGSTQTDDNIEYSPLPGFSDNTRYDIYSFTIGFIPTAELVASEDTSNYQQGYQNGVNAGKEQGYQEGYTNGFAEAKTQYENANENINSIFNGILSIGLIPLEFFMSIFNFEVLGINFTHIVSGLLTLMVLVIIIRIVLGGKKGD